MRILNHFDASSKYRLCTILFSAIMMVSTQRNGIPNWHFLLQNQQWKQQNSVKLFKINNKDYSMTSTTSLWCLYYLLRLSIVFINFKQVSHIVQVFLLLVLNM